MTLWALTENVQKWERQPFCFWVFIPTVEEASKRMATRSPLSTFFSHMQFVLEVLHLSSTVLLNNNQLRNNTRHYIQWFTSLLCPTIEWYNCCTPNATNVRNGDSAYYAYVCIYCVLTLKVFIVKFYNGNVHTCAEYRLDIRVLWSLGLEDILCVSVWQ